MCKYKLTLAATALTGLFLASYGAFAGHCGNGNAESVCSRQAQDTGYYQPAVFNTTRQVGGYRLFKAGYRTTDAYNQDLASSGWQRQAC